MANNDFTPYKLSTSAAEADKGISLAALAAKTPGILIFDGHGGAKIAIPGGDYGLPMLTGNGPPSAVVAATLGQHYFDMMATRPPYEYVNVGLTEAGYVWRIYGDTGVNFAPIGHFLTLADLNAAVTAGLVPAPTPGVAYYIGTAAPYDVYAYDGVSNDWLYIGKLTNTDKPDSGGELPPHGDAGTILAKASAADYDTAWLYPVDAISDNSLPGAKIADGSIPTPKYANQSITRAKLAPDALYSPWISQTSANYNITADDLGKTIRQTSAFPRSSSATITLTQTVSAAMPHGAEIAIMWMYGISCRLQASGVRFALMGNNNYIETGVSITDRFGMIAIKKYAPDATNGDLWLVTGPAEVIA